MSMPRSSPSAQAGDENPRGNKDDFDDEKGNERSEMDPNEDRIAEEERLLGGPGASWIASRKRMAGTKNGWVSIIGIIRVSRNVL